MEYSRRPTKSILKENQLKTLNKIYQTYLVSTTSLIKPLGTNFGDILIERGTVSFKEAHLKMSSAKMAASLSRGGGGGGGCWLGETCFS